MISNPGTGGEAADGTITARADCIVLQILLNRPDAALRQVGTHCDRFRRTAGGPQLAERRCVYDSLPVPNALCVPV